MSPLAADDAPDHHVHRAEPDASRGHRQPDLHAEGAVRDYRDWLVGALKSILGAVCNTIKSLLAMLGDAVRGYVSIEVVAARDSRMIHPRERARSLSHLDEPLDDRGVGPVPSEADPEPPQADERERHHHTRTHPVSHRRPRHAQRRDGAPASAFTMVRSYVKSTRCRGDAVGAQR
eukprot:1195119-Prorocentrum_minimum.AAC.4